MNNNISEEFRPISPWGYIGYQILFSIPIIGLIFILIYSFGDSNKNINLKNFAKSYLYIIIIAAIFALISIILSWITFHTLTYN